MEEVKIEVGNIYIVDVSSLRFKWSEETYNQLRNVTNREKYNIGIPSTFVFLWQNHSWYYFLHRETGQILYKQGPLRGSKKIGD